MKMKNMDCYGVSLKTMIVWLGNKEKGNHLSFHPFLHSMVSKNPIAILLSGLLLGTAAAFLGIGVGPINVAFLTLMFSFTMRDAAVYSVAAVSYTHLDVYKRQALWAVRI